MSRMCLCRPKLLARLCNIPFFLAIVVRDRYIGVLSDTHLIYAGVLPSAVTTGVLEHVESVHKG